MRSESQNQFDSLASKHASLSSNMNPSHPTPPPKDTANASLNSSLSGSVTAQSLANKSRKGPINKKGGKSMKVACYADDAKEPELIGECTVPIDEVLKQGEVDGESLATLISLIQSADPQSGTNSASKTNTAVKSTSN